MGYKVKILLGFLGLLFLAVGCLERKEFSDIPFVEFRDFRNMPNNRALFTFYFTDGDGDIGINPPDTRPPFNLASFYYYNFRMEYFEMRNGSWENIELAIPLFYRLPDISRIGQNPTLEGEIDVDIPGFPFFPNNGFDTCKFTFQLWDRALNPSNLGETPKIHKTQGLLP
ncbi:MAG: hypothetical protein ACXITV_05855 [Luteibaculaceae bacterium]